MSVSEVLRIAAKEVGYSRWADPQPGTKYGRWYADLVGDSYFAQNGVPYCAMFVTWVLYQADAQKRVPGIPSAYCPDILAAAKKQGRILASKRGAMPGDIVLFDWANKYGKGDLVADHIGFVEANKGNYLQTIEGNTRLDNSYNQGSGGKVLRKTRGFGDVQAVVRPSWNYEPSPSKIIEEDGVFGPKSTELLQKQLGVVEDGELWGQAPEWKARLWGVTSVTSWDSKGSPAIAALQQRLGVAADGIAGPVTIAALQTKLGVEPDTWWGSVTSRAFQKVLNEKTLVPRW